MSLRLTNPCPGCGLILLCGAIFDAVAQEENYGPILGLHEAARPETAKAGYVGFSSLWAPETMRELYRCPRCRWDPLVDVADADEKGERVTRES